MENLKLLQGWLKGVNSSAPFAWDMGRDGYGGTAYARDAFGYVLNYYEGDYEPISRSEQNKPFAEMTGVPGFRGLYNVNIASMSVYLPKLGTPVLYNYNYDQLNRLTAMQPLTGLDTAGNQWNAIAINNYKENLGYDANGNILKYVRYGHNGNIMDNLTYLYNSKTNQLNQITDKIGANKFEGDIDNQNPNNYLYDKTGNLTKDVKEGIDSIYWNVYGKIASIKKKDTTITYSYDAGGNRISKTVTKPGSSLTTWYVRDASGNVMSVYTRGDNSQNGGQLTQTETHLYGSSRIGLFKPNNNVESPPIKSYILLPGAGPAYFQSFERGRKVYELTNHLGNVLTTVSDRRIAIDTNHNNYLDYYTADILSQQDYYPFGMMMQGRSFSSGGYRYGFNGKENDNEVKGVGNQQDYGMRFYDPRVGRFLSVDPLTKNYPWYSPYQYAGNSPIKFIDLDGLEPANNPKAPGANEKKAMAIVDIAETMAARNDARDNFFSRSAWLTDDTDIKGVFNCGTGEYISDTKGDPTNKFNLNVYNGVTLNVDESQAAHTNNYEAFVVYRLIRNFASGKGSENYNFPTNGIISSKFLTSDIFKSALADFKSGKPVVDQQYKFEGGELANDVLRTGTFFSSITGFTGSGSITMIQTEKGVQVKIFNITSLYSGDLGKDIYGKLGLGKDEHSAKSYVRDPFQTTPYGNISQTYNLFIPNDSPLLND